MCLILALLPCWSDPELFRACCFCGMMRTPPGRNLVKRNGTMGTGVIRGWGLSLECGVFRTVKPAGSARVLAHFWCCLLCAFSVRFLYGVAESGHVQVTAGGPAVGGDVADSCTDEHQRALAVWERADDAGPATYLAVESFDHVVGADTPTMLDRVILEQVRGGLADALAQASGGFLEFPGFHLGGDLLGLGQCRVV